MNRQMVAGNPFNRPCADRMGAAPRRRRISRRARSHSSCPGRPGGTTDIAMRALADRDRKASRPVDRHREPARRRRHARARADGGVRKARRLHRRADADHGVPPSVHDQDDLRSDQDFTCIIGLTGYTFGVVVRSRFAVEDLGRTHRLRQGQSRQAHLWHAGRRHQPAHHHGADRQREGIKWVAGAVQGRRRGDDGAAGRPRRVHADSTGWASRSTPASCACWSPGARSAPRAGRRCRR